MNSELEGPPIFDVGDDVGNPNTDEFGQMLRQARSDLDCDIGYRDMWFNSDSDACDALTAAQVRYRNTLEGLASDFDDIGVTGIYVNRSCDELSGPAYNAVRDHCESLTEAGLAYQREVDAIVAEAQEQVASIDDSCLVNESVEVFVQEDGSSMLGPDVCFPGSDTDINGRDGAPPENNLWEFDNAWSAPAVSQPLPEIGLGHGSPQVTEPVAVPAPTGRYTVKN